MPARELRLRANSPFAGGEEREEVDDELDEDAGDEERNDRRKRTTSSRMSSSHRLSLKPSDARIRMSSSSTGSVKVCASCGFVADAGPSCTGVLNCQSNAVY